jgi:DNA-binding NtrC family response regulator
MVDVVVMNHDVDVLEAMATAVEAAGFTVAKRYAQEPVDELAAFIRQQDPKVIVYDFGPPPAELAVEKWRDLSRQPGASRAYVLTATYVHNLDADATTFECILLKPTTFDEVAAAIRRAISRAP